ncbi:GNAT family N-acetyltransferase [Candidatus Marsarchaeota archaeon]|nr:GNAT family N-acetyltransferase [Candidatus Marsarchaeota archaeon]
MPEFSIRLAREKDLPALSRFAAPIMASLKFYNEESTKKNIKEISQKELKGSLKWNRNNVIMAVANDGKIIGLGMHYLSSGHVDWLEWLLIDKNFRRKGLGRALVNYAIRNAKMRGGHKV